MKPEFSIWLLPNAAQEQMLQKTISELATALGGTAFSPHATIQGDLCHSAEDLSSPIEELARNFPIQRWPVEAVECGDHFFRCLYLRFDVQARLAEFQDCVRTFTQTDNGLAPFPHLSLAYGKVTDATLRARDELAGRFAGENVVFDRVALIRSSKDVPIAKWQILAQKALAG